MNRDAMLQQLQQTAEWDIVIIGGGATGLGAAVDAATRGYKTLLIEAYDFGKGTSSRSTKLVHGGVRYLAQGNIKLVMEALRERGYLLKNAEPVEIRRAIMEVSEKGYYLNNFVNRILLKKSHSRQKVVPSLNSEITLSAKEKDVLRFICMEFTAQEIAQKMEISPRTVEAIKDRLMERFGSKNTAGLVFFAVKNNLLD